MKPKRASARFRAYKQVSARLRERHPAAFPRSGRRPPLKVGILADLAACEEGELSRSRLKLFLAVWTASTAYLIGMAEGAGRVGLDGAPAGEVAQSHAAEAAVRLRERRQRIRARLDGPAASA